MKTFLSTILLLISLSGFSQKQNDEKPSMQRSELVKVRFLHELVKDLPKNCTSLSFEILAKAGGMETTAKGNTDELDEYTRNLLSWVDPQTKLYVDIKMNCPKPQLIILAIYIGD